MTNWDRLTPWRQGHFLSDHSVSCLHAILRIEGDDYVAIVVSHDCDLTQTPSVEPYLEVIVGKRMTAPNGNYTHGKNPRRLHLPAQGVDGPLWIDLNATKRCMVPKDMLANVNPSEEIEIDSKARNVLQFWLAARYRRSAFPDEFDRRLTNTGVGTRLRNILKSKGTHIVAVFFDVDEGDEREHKGEDDPYSLAIDLLYSTAQDPFCAKESADDAQQKIKTVFRECCYHKHSAKWRNIELVSCEPIADEAMTYAMSLQLKRWNADDISFRAEPVQHVMTE